MELFPFISGVHTEQNVTKCFIIYMGQLRFARTCFDSIGIIILKDNIL